MARKYKNHSSELKLKVALEAANNQKTINQIASDHGVAPVQVTEWKKQLLEEGPQLFQSKRKVKTPEAHEDVSYLQQQIGKLTTQIEWFKKKAGI
jgi:putative transposase